MKKLVDDKDLKDNRVKKPHFGMILPLVLVIIVLLGAFKVYTAINRFTSYTVSSAQKNNEEKKEIKFSVEQGEYTKDIAQKLENSGIIDSSTQFLYLCKRDNRGSSFQPGEYTLNNYMDFNEICNVLESGYVKKEYIDITVKEGMWAKEIGKYLEEQGLCTYDEFIEAVNSRDYDYDFVQDIPERDMLLEGYLFPDTYSITIGTSAKDIVNKMLERFDEIYSADLRAQTAAANKTIDEIVITASVIEAEVRYPDERKTVASVIKNRIEKGMKLQMDATVLYALGERKTRVLYADLEKEDSHNTYYVKGLPSGPICSPGAACIEAALDPADTDYLYYVLKDDASGEHYFTADYEDFEEAKAKYIGKLDNNN